MRRLAARAVFELTAKTVNADSDEVWRTDSEYANPRIEIGLKNSGERAAANTALRSSFPLRY